MQALTCRHGDEGDPASPPVTLHGLVSRFGQSAHWTVSPAFGRGVTVAVAVLLIERFSVGRRVSAAVFCVPVNELTLCDWTAGRYTRIAPHTVDLRPDRSPFGHAGR